MISIEHLKLIAKLSKMVKTPQDAAIFIAIAVCIIIIGLLMPADAIEEFLDDL